MQTNCWHSPHRFSTLTSFFLGQLDRAFLTSVSPVRRTLAAPQHITWHDKPKADARSSVDWHAPFNERANELFVCCSQKQMASVNAFVWLRGRNFPHDVRIVAGGINQEEKRRIGHRHQFDANNCNMKWTGRKYLRRLWWHYNPISSEAYILSRLCPHRVCCAL